MRSGDLLPVLFTLAACGRSGGPVTPADRRVVLERLVGDQQRVEGRDTSHPFVIRVTDPAGVPVSGMPLLWSPSGSGDSLFAIVDTTNADGVAQVRLIVACDTGARHIIVTAATGDSITFGLRVVASSTGCVASMLPSDARSTP